MENELTKEELYLEISNLSKEVKSLYKKLDKSEKYRTHFLSNMRNCIVNPFTSIMGLSEHIVKVQQHDWKKVIQVSALIHSEAFDLDFQLKNIFCAAEVEAGSKIPISVGINIPDHLEEEINSMRFLFRKKGINCIIEHENLDDVFYTDSAFISLILSNVIHNAYKYSKNDGEIHIKTNRTPNNIEFIIKDFGIGISKENRETIFNRFERINDEINSIDSGQGLGLSVVKMLLELLNGQILIESELNAYTEVRLMIPEMDNTGKESSDDSEVLDFFIDEGAIF